MPKWLLRKCVKCGKYTLETKKCPYCGGELRIPHPAKFSIDDKYAEYRVKMRMKSNQNES
jgi:H/ACA ribonucleoprotein complex subunit 3